jgi:hypothetical protein
VELGTRCCGRRLESGGGGDAVQIVGVHSSPITKHTHELNDADQETPLGLVDTPMARLTQLEGQATKRRELGEGRGKCRRLTGSQD